MAKRKSQSKADAPASEATDTSTKTRTSSRAKRPVDPSDEDIRQRAYQRYLERGDAAGSELDDWVQAEQDLRRQRR
jgi:hypothetical protein